jgi:hypothetical protein
MRHPITGIRGAKPRALSVAQILAEEAAQKRKGKRKRAKPKRKKPVNA